MEKLNLFELLAKLQSNEKLQGVKVTPMGKCYIRWVDRVLTESVVKEEYKQLAFVNVQNSVNFNILTDNFLHFNNQPIWDVEENNREGNESNGI